KQKDDVLDPLSVTNRVILQRLNFLYQASLYLQGLPGMSAAPSSLPDAGDNPKKEVKTTGKSNLDLLQNLRIKGTICKKCSAILVAGSTATVRMKSSKSHRHVITYTCTLCGASQHWKKAFLERLPPLSSLPDAGHVVFRGQEELVIDDQKGTGSFMA
ncbi:hypothetical protein BDQ17DRAFT_1364877, partial [Cyathus striatus]